MVARIQMCLLALKELWPLKKDLWNTGRPRTALFAAILTIVSFHFYEGAGWILILLTAGLFAGITMSIMIFNNIIDRSHDTKKGKTFAYQYATQLVIYWLLVNGITIFCWLPVLLASSKVGWFCGGIWLIGLLYSFVPGFYIGQNIIVAFCSASPAICGLIHDGQAKADPLLLFLVIFGLISIREIFKDIEDQGIDKGYKVTIPVRTASLARPDEHFYDHCQDWVPEEIYSEFKEAFPIIHPEILKSVKVILGITGWLAFLSIVFIGWKGAIVALLLVPLGPISLFLVRDPKKCLGPMKALIDVTLTTLLVLFLV